MKYRYLLFILVLIPFSVSANVSLTKCIDGDTARFKIENSEQVVRFLAIDTPELSKGGAVATIARNYTCDVLTNAKVIELEKDPLANADRYGRLLRWVHVDNKLLQEQLVIKGYAKVAYLYDDYKYNDVLLAKERIAKLQGVGIWQDTSNLEIIYYLLLIAVLMFLPKYSKELIKLIKIWYNKNSVRK